MLHVFLPRHDFRSITLFIGNESGTAFPRTGHGTRIRRGRWERHGKETWGKRVGRAVEATEGPVQSSERGGVLCRCDYPDEVIRWDQGTDFCLESFLKTGDMDISSNKNDIRR
jgi:hypothetical protein